MKKAITLLTLLCVATFATFTQQKDTFADPRDGKKYKTIKVGKQVWMAENLDYNATNSKCYNNDPIYCEKYGRLYNWETAMKACPVGWHLPSNAEWDMLGSSEEAFKLAPLLGGIGFQNDNFSFADDNCYYWSATEAFLMVYRKGEKPTMQDNAIDAYYLLIADDGYAGFFTINKINLLSVRCIQD